VEEWQKRTIERITPADMDEFQAARARVAKNLAYSMIQSNRDAMARQAMTYCDGHAKDRVSRLLNAASRHGRGTWKLACLAFRLREFVRDKCLRVRNLGMKRN